MTRRFWIKPEALALLGKTYDQVLAMTLRQLAEWAFDHGYDLKVGEHNNGPGLAIRVERPAEGKAEG